MGAREPGPRRGSVLRVGSRRRGDGPRSYQHESARPLERPQRRPFLFRTLVADQGAGGLGRRRLQAGSGAASRRDRDARRPRGEAPSPQRRAPEAKALLPQGDLPRSCAWRSLTVVRFWLHGRLAWFRPRPRRGVPHRAC